MSHVRILRNVQVDGKEVAADVYPVSSFNAGNIESLVAAGWAELTDQPKKASRAVTDDDDSPPLTPPPKPPRKRK